jgi:circadian clock protein KaiB
MGRKKTNGNVSRPRAATEVVMRLYVAGGAPNSLQAIANLEAICKARPHQSFALEIIDVLKHPMRALADGILVTPSLSKLSPGSMTRIVGNLSNATAVLSALGLLA